MATSFEPSRRSVAYEMIERQKLEDIGNRDQVRADNDHKTKVAVRASLANLALVALFTYFHVWWLVVPLALIALATPVWLACDFLQQICLVNSAHFQILRRELILTRELSQD